MGPCDFTFVVLVMCGALGSDDVFGGGGAEVADEVPPLVIVPLVDGLVLLLCAALRAAAHY